MNITGPYRKELSCKKSKKSSGPFLRKTGNHLSTNQLTNGNDSPGPSLTKLQVQNMSNYTVPLIENEVFPSTGKSPVLTIVKFSRLSPRDMELGCTSNLYEILQSKFQS